jgi:DNA-binding transcriptional regulator GbsR (MarR family)
MDKIRDLREKYFQVDDEYLNGYARLCGINATGVYLSMCRHANKQQICFPSKKLIAEELDISQRSVYTAIKKLEEWGIIGVREQGRKKNGSYKVKVYTLLDKTTWKHKPQANGAVGKKRHSPQANNDTPPQATVAQEGNTEEKETQKKEMQIATKVASFSENEKKHDKPMTLQQFVSACQKSTQRHVQIIGEWADTVRPELITHDQWQTYLKRHLRAARDLSPFSQEQLDVGYRKMMEEKDWLKRYTLETLIKFVT